MFNTVFKQAVAPFLYAYVCFKGGVSHEKNAIDAYYKIAATAHKELIITQCGLFIDITRPYIGASPDAIINCKRCGFGVLKVKCPFSFKSGIPESIPLDCFLQKRDGCLSLKCNHKNHYQAQLQLVVCHALYCDFIVWTPTSFHLERITEDKSFIADNLDSLYLWVAARDCWKVVH